jgi:hypothetical protein
MADNTPKSSKHTFTQKYSGQQIFIVVSIVIVALLLDTTIIRVSDLTLKSTSSWPIGLFIIIAAISLVGQNLIMRFIKEKVDESIAAQKSLNLNSLYKVAVTVHYVLAAILVFVILQMLITSRYNVVLLITAITISYVFAIIMMVILCHRFFSWFRLNKSYVILLYGLSSIMLVANTCVTLGLVNILLVDKPPEVIISRATSLSVPVVNANPVNSTLNYAYIITTITSFIITWCATAIGLLKNYIHKIGKFRYSLVIILPLAYFVSQFLVFSLGLIGPVLIANPIFYGILFTTLFALSKPIGGIIFGIGFWMIAKNIHKDNIVRSYLIISAYGFLLLFTSNQAIVLIFTQYPPFGLVTISFVGLSSYLVLLGIYSSAISMSKDANLRREIRRLAIRESKLLDSIGSAQIEEEVRKRVLHIARLKKSDSGEAGVPSALDEEDMKQYLGDALKEINAIKKKGSFTSEKT